jgi:hypothetical protein
LLEAFDDLCHKEQAVTSTIITNPLIGDHHFENYPRDMTEERIGQFTALPQGLSGAELENHLMQSIHVKTRNLVRKGFKSGFDIREDDSEAAMRTLAAVHWDNMAKIGGTHKPWKIFQSIRDNFHYGNEYRVYTASRDGEVAAALLVFFCNETAEYFTPVIRPKYRSDQPLSALIFTAMLDSVSLGCRQWNWGGTWLNQDGVYHFKSRWGTRDIHYRYLVRAYLGIEQIKTSNRSEIQCMYPYFYVLPYPELEGANDEL